MYNYSSNIRKSSKNMGMHTYIFTFVHRNIQSKIFQAIYLKNKIIFSCTACPLEQSNTRNVKRVLASHTSELEAAS